MVVRTRDTGPRTAVSIVSYCLAALFIGAGLTKLWGAQMVEQQFAGWSYPPALMYMVGVVEVLAGSLLITVSARAVGAALLGMVMMGAAVTHFFAQQWAAIAVPAVIFVVLVWIAMRSPVRFVSSVEPGTPILHTEAGSSQAGPPQR